MKKVIEAKENADYVSETKHQSDLMELNQNNPQQSPQNEWTDQQKESYFKRTHPEFGSDELLTSFSVIASQKVYSDPLFRHLSDKEKLDEVSRQTSLKFQNPYRSQSPVQGQSQHDVIPDEVTISRAQAEQYKKIYNLKSDRDVVKKYKEIQKKYG